MHHFYLNRVFDSKSRMVLRARESWPTYVTYDENKDPMSDT